MDSGLFRRGTFFKCFSLERGSLDIFLLRLPNSFLRSRVYIRKCFHFISKFNTDYFEILLIFIIIFKFR